MPDLKKAPPADWLRDAVVARVQELGISGAELARRSGVNQSQVSRYLAGVQSIASGSLQHLLTALDLTVVARGRKKR